MEEIWLIEPEYLKGYLDKTENISAEDIQAAANQFRLETNPNILDINGNVATISILGQLSKRPSTPIDSFFGFQRTNYTDILDSISVLNESPAVDTVILKMNTPGGLVEGADEVFQGLMKLRDTKTIIAENNGMIASAGYWLASAANEIIAISPAVMTGSIGVMISAIDYSKLDAERGIKEIRIVSKNAFKKNPDIGSKEGRSLLQDRVDAVERIFHARIAEGRNIPVTQVKDKFGKGALLVAQDPDPYTEDALDVGMIDRLESANKNLKTAVRRSEMFIQDNGNDIVAGASGATGLPIVDKPWDASAAKKRMRKGATKPAADYKRGFFWFDAKNSENFGAYKLPFADIVGGKLVAIRRGVFAAKGAMAGARGGVSIPSGDRSAVMARINSYVKRIEKEGQKKKALSTPDFGKTQKEVITMLDQLMADNPDLKTIIDAKVKEAYESGFTAGKDEVQKRVVAVSAYIEKDAGYPQAIQTMAVKVLKDESKIEALEGAVVAFDAYKEMNASDNAADETNGQNETPLKDGETQMAAKDGTISNNIDFEAAKARQLKEQGRG